MCEALIQQDELVDSGKKIWNMKNLLKTNVLCGIFVEG
jgi:hypothetical protein